MKFTVYQWHYGANDPLAEGLTVEEVLAFKSAEGKEFRYVKFDKELKVAWLTNCCNFRTH